MFLIGLDQPLSKFHSIYFAKLTFVGGSFLRPLEDGSFNKSGRDATVWASGFLMLHFEKSASALYFSGHNMSVCFVVTADNDETEFILPLLA